MVLLELSCKPAKEFSWQLALSVVKSPAKILSLGRRHPPASEGSGGKPNHVQRIFFVKCNISNGPFMHLLEILQLCRTFVQRASTRRFLLLAF